MNLVNINAPETIKAVYPRQMFEADAGMNSLATARILRGLRIETAPDGSGSFRLARAAHLVGETKPEAGTIFVCPYMGRAYGLFSLAAGVHGPVVENFSPFETHPEEYDAFIRSVIDAARAFGQKKARAAS